MKVTSAPARPSERGTTFRSRPAWVERSWRAAVRAVRDVARAARVALDVLYWTATLQLGARIRRQIHARLIRRSGLFNAQFYLSQCAGEADAHRDPLTHYLLHGAARGIDPSPLFDTSAYLERNPAAAAPRQNPLVHFIRSGRGAARAAAPDASPPNAAATSRGEDLLRSHPFRAPALASARELRPVLVVDERLPAERSAGTARAFELVRLLREMGYAVTFVSDREGEEHRVEDALRQLRVGVYRGFASALAHLAAEGHRYVGALLAQREQGFRYLPVVRAYCPHARVIYDAVEPRPLRVRAHPGPAAETAPEDPARLESMERLSGACSDAVLVPTAQEREALLARLPGARVEVVAEIPRQGRERELLKELLEAVLLGGRAPEASPRAEGTSTERGRAAWTA